jgi:hypothetical protein
MRDAVYGFAGGAAVCAAKGATASDPMNATIRARIETDLRS